MMLLTDALRFYICFVRSGELIVATRNTMPLFSCTLVSAVRTGNAFLILFVRSFSTVTWELNYSD